jgi:hypothetical protein
MGSIRNLGSTGIYAYTSLISIFICAPGIFFFERDVLAAAQQAAAKYGAAYFYGSMLSVGMLYHLYNQVRWAAQLQHAWKGLMMCHIASCLTAPAFSCSLPSTHWRA